MESKGSRSNQHEERISELEDEVYAANDIIRDTLKTTKEHGNWFPQLVNDFKNLEYYRYKRTIRR